MPSTTNATGEPRFVHRRRPDDPHTLDAPTARPARPRPARARAPRRRPSRSSCRYLAAARQSDDLRRHRRAGLEPLRRRRVGGVLHRDGLDHRAAGDERRHRVQQLASAVQHANTIGAQHLMAGERREVDVERMEVDRLVRHRLAGVQHRQRADRLRPRDQLGDRSHRAGDVGMVAERNDFHALVELEASRGRCGRRR